jgi:23S rRNA (adenine2503-C2)-methyltransferase
MNATKLTSQYTEMWNDVTVLSSDNSNVWKFIFTKDDVCVESVLYRYPTFKERTVMCMSTQCGCPMGCSFCGTGKQFVRNLTEPEMFSQFQIMCEFIYGIDGTLMSDVEKAQLMFMSMGEPLLNMDELSEVMECVHMLYPEMQLLVSTAAPATEKGWAKFFEIAEQIPTVGLQFSVHEAFDEDRNAIIPIKAKCNLDDIAYYGNAFYSLTGRRPFFNYCVHDKNNTDGHANKLSGLFDPEVWECTLSVICEKDETMKSSIDRQLDLINDFSGKLVNLGFNTRVFNPAGQDDIGGGCGQLFHTQRWMKENADKVKQMKYRS